MKIAIGTNLFGNYSRQEIAKKSMIRLKDNFKDSLDLFDFQFSDEHGVYKESAGFSTSYSLKRSSKDVCSGDKKLPFVNDILNELSSLDGYDYFIFTNSDVILSDRLINTILNGDIIAMPCSRLDIKEIQTLDEPIVPVRWEIAGFDTFVFKTSWFRDNSFRFKDYLLGRPYFDLAYASIMKIFGKNDLLGNKNPALCFHIHHGIASVINDNEEKEFNKKTYLDNDQLTSNILSYYIRNFLLNRNPPHQFLQEIPNEKGVEIKYFDQFKI